MGEELFQRKMKEADEVKINKYMYVIELATSIRFFYM